MSNLNCFDVLIIGAGASALMCAANLNKKQKIALIDANKCVGAKLKISGGGRCNIVNKNITCQDFLGNCEFLKELFLNFSYKDILDFFNGIKFEIKNNSQFFCKNSAKEIVDFLYSKISHCKIFLDQKCLHVKKIDDVFCVHCKDKIFYTKKLIVASGGLSFSSLNSSAIGYEIAQSFSHKISPLAPALVGFSV